jgi:hypothetical protein
VAFHQTIQLLFACCPAGVVGCALVYSDYNVTTRLTPGKQVRICNDRWASFATFDRVAIINGSVLASQKIDEQQAMGLLQLLKLVDGSITPEWAIRKKLLSNTIWESDIGIGQAVSTPSKSFRWAVVTRSTTTKKAVVTELYLLFVQGANEYYAGLPDAVNDPMQYLPSLDDDLVSGLRSLTDLQYLWIQVGSGTLLPQLALLSQQMQELHIEYFCLRGPIPINLLVNMTQLYGLRVQPYEAAKGAADPAGGLCGLTGSLPHLRLSKTAPEGFYSMLFLANNQLTGKLPAELLLFARTIDLQGNQFVGDIPSMTVGVKTPLQRIVLSNNKLTVRFANIRGSALQHTCAVQC